ncbi:hypothetical protein N9L66_04610 [Porticoccaceae bacterium]|nr:hypothetical protein [Porticoccaceae bacterium]MDB2343132.1 hypothetical protein [Porticoccaceae bacterium]
MSAKSEYFYSGNKYPEFSGGQVLLSDIAQSAGLEARVVRNRVRSKIRQRSRLADSPLPGGPIVGSFVITDDDLGPVTRGVRKLAGRVANKSHRVAPKNYLSMPLISRA